MEIVVVVIAIAIYLLPAMVASERRHRNAVAIFLLNLLLGWTLLFWVLALVWAATSNVEPKPEAAPHIRISR